MADKIHDNESDVEAEIKARIDITKQYQETKDLSWSLNTVIKNWDKTLSWRKEF
ncbi:MAG: hypothetical protein HOG49_17690 [Candidatus Scalindua sp.]|jgi:hypothetical protein|nr:hypothetical protein [Candidatus Scalindua sp.]